MLTATIHPLQRELRHPSIVDLTYTSPDGTESLFGNVSLNTLHALGVSPEALAAISNGDSVNIVAFADYEVPGGEE